MDLVRERYADFGPTFAREKLVEVHGFRLSAETLRKWMLEDGPRRAKPRQQARPNWKPALDHPWRRAALTSAPSVHGPAAPANPATSAWARKTGKGTFLLWFDRSRTGC